MKYTSKEIAEEMTFGMEMWHALDVSNDPLRIQPAGEDDAVFDIPTTSGQRFRVTVQEMK